MKAILEFNLDEFFERKAHMRAVKATDVYLAVNDTFDKLRRLIKYEDISEEKREAFEEIRTFLAEALENRNINISEELE
jgi:uncharacterized protein (DUF2267 family)